MITLKTSFGSCRHGRNSAMLRHLGLALALAAVAPVGRAGAPGEVDLAFDPPPDNTQGQYYFQAGDQIYAAPFGPSFRFGRDGQHDPSWLAPSAQRPYFGGEHQLADGRLVLRDSFDGVVIFSPTGELLASAPSNLPRNEIYPNPDGTWTFFGVGSPNPFGPWPQFANEDLSFPVLRPPVPPWRGSVVTDTAGGIAGGDANASFVISARDAEHRFVVGGNITRLDGLDRPGFARFFRDGSLDRTWNPGPALGLLLDADGNLNGMPRAVVAAPEGGVEVVVRFPAEPIGQRNRFARIRADGSVARQVTVTGFEYNSDFPMLVQPDGRTVVGGTFTNVNQHAVTGLVRLNADGSVDESFQVVLTSAQSPVRISTMGLQSDGYLWIGGNFKTVNGISRPGLARVLAYSPSAAAPTLSWEQTQPRVAPDELLHLTATATGSPLPTFQWLSNGVPIPGANFRGYSLAVGHSVSLPTLELVASNAVGVARLTVPTIQLARRTPAPGRAESPAVVRLSQFGYVHSWLTLPDGSSLLAGSANPVSIESPLSETNQPMILRLTGNRQVDPDFGSEGAVWGNGHVERLLLEPDGRIWVLGHFTEIAGRTVAGTALLDPQGRFIDANWPRFDQPNLTAGLRLPGGERLIAGLFAQVNERPVFRLVRLKADGNIDDTFTSPLIPDQVIDDMGRDTAGRIVVVGARAPQLLNTAVRVRRLLTDGSWDASFQAIPATIHFPTTGVTGLRALPDGRWLLLNPPILLGENGDVQVQYQVADSRFRSTTTELSSPSALLGPDGMVYAIVPTGIGAGARINRWSLEGQFDYNFEVVPPMTLLNPQTALTPGVSAMQMDTSGELAVFARAIAAPDPGAPLESATGILRYPGDADRRLRIAAPGSGGLSITLPTRAGRTYGVWERPTLNSPLRSRVAEFLGDGYEQSLRLPPSAGLGFYWLGP